MKTAIPIAFIGNLGVKVAMAVPPADGVTVAYSIST